MFLKSKGNSMFPMLWDQDIVQISQISSRNIKIDDIVVIYANSHYITHRVVYKDPSNKWVVTKGDNNPLPDGKVDLKRIKGKVISIYRKKQIIRIKDYYLFQSTYYHQEILAFKKKLDFYHIKYVFLKGLPLHLYYLNTLPQRIFSDCDILIDPRKRLKVDEILSELGFTKRLSDHSPLHNHIKEDIHAFEYLKIKGMFPIVFDIHYKVALVETKLGETNLLFPNKLMRQFSKKLLDSAVKQTIMGEEYPILRHEYLIVYLATHIFHHNFMGYQRYIFLSQILTHSSFDIKKVHQIIYRYRLTNFLYPSFLFLKKYYAPNIHSSFYDLEIKEEKKKVTFILLNKISIFKDEDLLQAAYSRLKLIYALSEVNWFIKNYIFFIYGIRALIFITPSTLYKISKKLIHNPLFFYKNFFFK